MLPALGTLSSQGPPPGHLLGEPPVPPLASRGRPTTAPSPDLYCHRTPSHLELSSTCPQQLQARPQTQQVFGGPKSEESAGYEVLWSLSSALSSLLGWLLEANPQGLQHYRRETRRL